MIHLTLYTRSQPHSSSFHAVPGHTQVRHRCCFLEATIVLPPRSTGAQAYNTEDVARKREQSKEAHVYSNLPKSTRDQVTENHYTHTRIVATNGRLRSTIPDQNEHTNNEQRDAHVQQHDRHLSSI